MMTRTVRAALAAFILLSACGESNPNEDCLEQLAKDQSRAASRTAQELERIADTIEGALDIQMEGGLDRGQERLLSGAQGRARSAKEDLEQSFSVGCE